MPTESGRRLATADIVPTGARIAFDFEGRRIEALEGETVAAALTAGGILDLRRDRAGGGRGLHCGMGVCFECLVTVDGRASQRACLVKAAQGQQVRRQPYAADGSRDLAPSPSGDIETRRYAVAVVGAGPAGLAAAEAAAGASGGVIVVDERPEPGGQFFKQLAPSHRFAGSAAADGQFAQGQALIARVRAAGVTVLSGATVWAAQRAGAGFELEVLDGERALRVACDRVVIAGGAYERPFPVPGWTLPGFMTTGAAQTLARAYRVAPGRRVVVAGNGPLNFQVAAELASAGVAVAAVAEAAPLFSPDRIGAGLRAGAFAPRLIAQGLGYLMALRRRGVSVFSRHVLLRAEGSDRVERAVLAKLDDEGRPLTGTEVVIDTEAICVGYGFIASSELSRALGCEHEVVGGPFPSLVVRRDDSGRTSVPGVFVAGDGGGLGGAQAALCQGRLAGLAAASGEPPEGGTARRLARHRAFQSALWSLFAARIDQPALLTEETLVCRCEEVTAKSILMEIARGADAVGVLKRMTRAGMGRCQGRYCGPVLAALLARAGHAVADEDSFFAPRFPTKPLPLAVAAVEQPEWSEAETGGLPPARPRPPRCAAVGEAAVAVIGAGIIGSSVAHCLARDGVDVAVIERDEPGAHASGNNAGSLHVQMLAYDFEQSGEARARRAGEVLPLQRDSAKLWCEVEREIGLDLEIAVTGGLMVAEDATALAALRRKVALERALGIDAEAIGADELRRLAPELAGHLAGAAWCPDEGKINPMKATRAVADAALAAGARLFHNVEVTAIERESAGFMITTNAGPFRAGKILAAGGGWSSALAAMVGVALPSRAAPIQLVVTEPAPPMVRHLVACVGRHLSLKQVANGNLLIGGGWTAGLEPRRHRPWVTRESFEGNLWVAARVLPALARLHVIRSWAAMNVNIDGAPVLGEVPGVPGFYIATTVNGVTLGPLLGRLMAETIRTGRPARSIAAFSIDRFRPTSA